MSGFSKAVTSQASVQIEGNLRKVLNELRIPTEAFDSVKISGIDGQGVKAIAEAQARALTKPDIQVQQLERLKDISKVLSDVSTGSSLKVNESDQNFKDQISKAAGIKPKKN